MEKPENQTFGHYLKHLREAKGYSMNQLALYAGVSTAYISRLESGDREPPSPTVLRRFAEHLPVSYEELMHAAGYLEDPMDAPWIDKLTPQTRKKLEAVGGLRNFHTRFLGGKGLNDLEQEDLETILEVYFRHLEAAKAARTAAEKTE